MTIYLLCRRAVFLLGVVAAIQPVIADEPEFLRHTPSNRDSFFYIADPLPHLQSALESVAFERLTDVVNGMGPSPMPNAEVISARLKQGAAYIPTEIAVTTTGSEIGGFGRMFHVGLLVALCGGAIETEQTKALSDLHKALATELRKLKFDSTDVWLNFRSPIPAAILFGQATGLAAYLESEGLAEADFTDGIMVTVSAQSWIPDQLTALYFLREMDVIDDLDSSSAKKIANAAMKLKVSFHLRQHGKALRLTLGDVPAASEEANADVFDGLVGPDETLLMSGRYQLAELRQEVRHVNDLWGQWKGSDIGDAVQAWDTDDFLNDLGSIEETLRMAGDEGRFVVYGDSGIRGQWTEFGVPDSPTLAESGLLDVLPDSEGFLSASSMKSLGVSLSDMLSQFESRLATNSLKYEMTGRQQQAEMTNWLETYYYGKMSDFRRLIKVDAVAAFEPPVATMMDARGSIAELHLTFQGEQGPNELLMKDLQCPRLAVIGGLKAGKDVRSLVGDIWKTFYNGVSQEEFDFETIIDDHDRLGHPAWFFTSDWQFSLPSEVKISAQGFEPHFFVIDDRWFVFSTSPGLSKEILKTSAQPTRASSIPGQLTGFGRVPMRTFAEMLRTATDGLARVVADDGNIVLTGRELSQFRQVLRNEQGKRLGALAGLEFFSTLIEVVEHCSWESRLTEKTCTTDFRLEFPEF